MLLSLYTGINLASEAAWNCKQGKDGKEWVCVGESEPASATEPAKAPEPDLPRQVQTEQPAVAKPVKEVKPIISVSEKAKAVPAGVQTAESARQPGWTCKAGEKEQNWNCDLVGADPKGKARVVETEERKYTILEPAFDTMQEQIFNTLSSQLKYDPWANCTIQMAPEPSFEKKKHLREVSPLKIKSNYSEVFENEISSYSGNVEISRADQYSLSNAAQYDSVSQTLDLHGDVYYSDDDLAVYTNSATLELPEDKAQLRNVMFIDPKTPLRGRAKVAYRDSKDFSRYQDVAYTSCPPNNQDWVLHASDLKINDLTGKGSAKNTWLEVKGLPVFYSPYLSFPIDNRRLSGFLAPSYGKTKFGGFYFSVPYYWNIAPNYDATLTPRYLTDRGLMLGGDFRLLTKYSNSVANLEFMPNDSVREQSRFFGGFDNYSQFTSNISSNMDLNYVSDKDFFAELGNAFSFPNFSYLRSTADLTYKDENILLSGYLENYQNIDETLQNFKYPYRRLPQVTFNLDHAFDSMPLYTAMENEYVFFEQSDKVNGHRVDIKPSVSFPLQSTAGYVTPKISLQHTDYLLSNQNTQNFTNADNDPANPDSPEIFQSLPTWAWNSESDTISRTLPILSLDSGTVFEKNLDFARTSLKHTIEPRLFYLYIPQQDQSDIPLFDSSLYDFWFSSLFRENRFSGSDRIQDANQVTAALTTRLLDPVNGRERLKLSIGEIIYFKNREVTAPVLLNFPGAIRIPNGYLATPAETSSLSPLVTELSSQFSDHWLGETGVQWDPDTNDIVRGRALLHYLDESQQIFNIGFLYRKDNSVKRTLEFNKDVINAYNFNPNYDPFNDRTLIRSNDIIQNDISFRWPLISDWYAVGRWQYSWLYNKTQETFLGLEKESCCWRFRVIGRRYTNTASSLPDASSQTGVFFQFELKGLTGIGESLDTFFEQSIFGYRKP
ncbi:MAG: LPS-assembly protein LptD [Gammaproteobacteria bacterium]